MGDLAVGAHLKTRAPVAEVAQTAFITSQEPCHDPAAVNEEHLNYLHKISHVGPRLLSSVSCQCSLGFAALELGSFVGLGCTCHMTVTLMHILYSLQSCRHCATHQIRLILVSSVVISCLLFPAIAVYSSTKTESFALSFRVFDALLTPEDLSAYFSFDDIRQIWEGQDTLHVRDDSIARARCGKGGIVRLERILIHDAEETEDTYSTLSQRALMSTLNFERRLSEQLAHHKTPCLRSPQGRCLVLSPLAFWDYEEGLLLRDINVLTTLGPTRNASAHGFTITTDMVLSGRDGGDDPGDAAYPVLTYFFPEADCLSNHGHNSWLNTVEEAAASMHSGTIVMTQEPQLLALEVSILFGCIFAILNLICSTRRSLHQRLIPPC